MEPFLDLVSPSMEGERSQVDLPNQTFLWTTNGQQLRLHGRLLVSTYQMRFVPDEDALKVVIRHRLPLDLFEVALASIAKVEQTLAETKGPVDPWMPQKKSPGVMKKSRSMLSSLKHKVTGGGSKTAASMVQHPPEYRGGAEDSFVQVYTKDCRVLTFGFSDPPQCEQVHKIVKTFAFPRELKYLFAFDGAPVDETWRGVDGSVASSSMYGAYDRDREWARMGISSDARYRVCTANSAFALCNTYPGRTIVPATVSDVFLKSVATFRSSARFPLFCWAEPPRGGAARGALATLWRSSQPLVGTQGDKSHSDEQMLRDIAEACPAHAAAARAGAARAGGPGGRATPMLIADCRPRLNAETNKVTKHGGYETAERYPFAELAFLGIANIHEMRHSLRALTTLVCKADSSSDNWQWLAKVEGTRWLGHVRRVLAGGIRVAAALVTGRAVLVHCR